MGTAFVQMAYSLVDLLWLGKLSTNAVAAVGTSGFFVWIAQAITLIAGTGISVGLAQAYGKEDNEAAEKIVRSGFQVNAFNCIALMAFYLIFRNNIIGMYNLEPILEQMTIDYFVIVTIGFIFIFSTAAMSSAFYARGNSITPFRISLISLIINIILDPILIFGIGPFPRLEIQGAALATVIAQIINALLYLYLGVKDREIYVRINYSKTFNKESIKDVLRLGVPVSIQSIIHALVGVKLNQYIASYGSVGIAVYAIGSQIESISWMSAEGFAKAFSAFFGQNYGARDFERLERGKKEGMKIIVVLGIFATALLFFFSKPLFKIFIPNDPIAVEYGSWYLKIIAISELFMAIEIGVTGMLNGMGLTKYPAINAVVLNIARIPFAKLLIPVFALNGIWASMSLSSVLKGIVILVIYKYLFSKTNGFRENMNKYIHKTEQIM
ncbi:MATE family efflux transporter [Peptoniphilus stercorisuis]|uniref:Probable multidrug resistance protein NorM n=1 Tax=Peptoniphilus stercorisuis TaxID=1436965 RepID=A0ABS4KD43_9FIRM|nr:MATE family efflux transporter [Peptoniphilus stercorisuis]MBP2025704.1 putative MATE family efflux protein [Peptoniphilus stercorisuis]